MDRHLTGRWMIAGLSAVAVALAGCTSDPNAPINRTAPIRQMDNFFDSLSGQPRSDYAHEPDYEHEPGYAPAYPPYSY